MRTKLIMFFLFIAANVFAQKVVYCDLAGHSNIHRTKVNIEVDLGQSHRGEYAKTTQLVDDKGDKIVFKSMADAANYMAERGWKVISCYNIIIPTLRGEEHEIHFIMEKTLNEGDLITDGLLFAK